MTKVSDAQNLAAISTPAEADRWSVETVLDVRRWTPRLLSFRISRPAEFRFTPGHYARLGLAAAAGELVWRPLSMVSAGHEKVLEFVVALVPSGAFSGLIAEIKAGDLIRLDKSCFGFLTLDQLAAGQDLWLLASGTGIGPFVSMLRSPDTWRAYRNLIVVHSVREARELVYRDELEGYRAESGDRGRGRFQYCPAVTREPCPGALAARIPALLEDGRLAGATGIDLDVAKSRVMVCGNPEMAKELRHWFGNRGFQTSRRGVPGTIAFEKYW